MDAITTKQIVAEIKRSNLWRRGYKDAYDGIIPAICQPEGTPSDINDYFRGYEEGLSRLRHEHRTAGNFKDEQIEDHF